MIFAVESKSYFIENVWPVLLGLGGLFSFMVAIRQYRLAQKWKRLEFVAQEIKLFETDTSVKKVLCMLEWNKRRIELLPNDSDLSKRMVLVNNEKIAKALEFHKDREKPGKPCVYSLDEVAIRDLFDELLTYLNRFGHYLKVGVIQPKDILPYLQYWLAILTDPNSSLMKEECRLAIHGYVVNYDNTGAQELLNKYCTLNKFPQLRKKKSYTDAAPISVASTIV